MRTEEKKMIRVERGSQRPGRFREERVIISRELFLLVLENDQEPLVLEAR